MNLITVNVLFEADDETEPLMYVVTAETEAQALQLVRDELGTRPYAGIEIAAIIEGHFGAHAHVIGYAGQGAFTWK